MAQHQDNIGIVLINVGTPNSPHPRDIRPYLIEFLSDKHIIRVPHAVWLPILHGFIANTRPKKTAPRYRQIWTEDGAPLLVESYKQRDVLNERFAQAGIPAQCEIGMRYGEPSIAQALQRLQNSRCNRIIGLPLFPQTATCTVGTCVEKLQTEVSKAAKTNPVKLMGIKEGYYDNPLYWKALAQSIKDIWEWKPGSKLLFSFHSIPLSDVSAGNTYLDECRISVERVTDLLGLTPDDWALAYHSRFEDSRSWAAPHPKTVLATWADEGIERIALVTPGFAADCLESLYDIASSAKEYFEQLCRARGGQPDVTFIPSLNSRTDHIDLLFDVIVQYIKAH